MKNENTDTLPMDREKESRKVAEHCTLEKSSGRRKWEDENWEKEVAVATFDNKPVRKVTIVSEKHDGGYCIYKLTGKGSEKMAWKNLSVSHKKAFREVINSFSNSEEFPAMPHAEGFTFAYSDDKVVLSAICMALQGKLMLFYKELAV